MSDDDLPLPQICTTALNLRRTQQQHDRDEAGPAWQADKLVFTARYGTPIEPRNFNRSWDARCAEAGVRKITVHDGRRSCGTLLADLDVHPRVAMQILRHADFALAMEIYTLASSAQPQRASPTRPAAPSTVGQLAPPGLPTPGSRAPRRAPPAGGRHRGRRGHRD